MPATARILAANVTFLAIDELRCHGVIRRELSEIWMAMQLAGDAWLAAPTDFVCHRFWLGPGMGSP